MSILFKHLRVHQIFGANTDVGKTILTSALARVSAYRNDGVFYLKPISTGPPESADDRHVKRYAGPVAQKIQTGCLFRYSEPVSPHLASKLASESGGPEAPSDKTFVNAIASYVRRCAASTTDYAHMYIETAGGVHSPTLSGTTQADAYRPLFLPTILIGDAALGGISSTIAAYESLLLRGYIIDAVLLFRDAYYRNAEYLAPFFAARGVHLATVDKPPPVRMDENINFEETSRYYESIAPAHGGQSSLGLVETVQYLDECHRRRIEELESMPRRTLDCVWWPFVQHGLVKGEEDVTVIDSAYSDFFSVYKPHSPSSAVTRPGNGEQSKSPHGTSLLEPQFDGSASWWTQTLGHADSRLTLAAARASGRYGHVMFPQATHLPALQLAEELVHAGPGRGWAGRAFFSDNGSTGMEVALKMALRAFVRRCAGGREGEEVREEKKLGVLGLKGSYHGDTIGAMDACEEGVYTCEWHDAKGYWFDPPTVGIRNGQVEITLPPALAAAAGAKRGVVQATSLEWAYDVPARLNSDLAHVYSEYVRGTLERLRQAGGPRLAALVIEPLVMGAGGMVFVDPLFQRVMINSVRTSQELAPPAPPPTAKGSGVEDEEWHGLPVIFDEVFVGLYRLGHMSSAVLLDVFPDISVHAKVLTGGLVPMAVTLAREGIFKAFWGDGKAEALLHGHSYTAHAVGCEVALETGRVIQALKRGGVWREAREKWGEGAEEALEGVEGEGRQEPKVWSFWDKGFVMALSKLGVVDEVMAMGCVLAVKIQDGSTAVGYVSKSAQTIFEALKSSLHDEGGQAPGGAPFGVHFRTLGNVGYFMTSFNTGGDVVRAVEDRIWGILVASQK